VQYVVHTAKRNLSLARI